MRRLLLLVPLVLLVGCRDDPTPDAGMDASAQDAGGPATIEVRVVAMNDLHGRLEAPDDGSNGGLAHAARLVRELEAEQPNTLLVAAGDMIGGSAPLSGLLYDEPTVAAMNAMGFDVVGVGNHEFDRPVDELTRLLSGGCHPDGCVLGDAWGGSELPWLGANVLDATTGEPVLDETAILEIGGARIAFIGVTLENTDRIVVAENVVDLRFADEVETVNALVPSIQAMGVEAIVVLLHQGGWTSAGGPNNCIGPGGPAFPIAEAFDPAVDLVISGHTHRAYVCTDPLVTQAGGEGRMLTVIDLAIDRETGDVVSARAVNRDVTPDGEEDPDVRAVLDSYVPLVQPRVDRVVGQITEDIGSRADAAHQAAAGFLVADAFLEAARGEGAVAGVTNLAGIRSYLEFDRAGPETADGQVRFGELFEMSPFANAVVTMTLTGAQLERLLEGQLATGGGNYVQPSASLTWTWQPAAPAGDQIDPADIFVEGAPIDLGATYRVAVNSFIAGGPGGYEVLTEGTDLVTGVVDTQAIEDYLSTRSPYAPAPLDRVRTR